MPRLRTLPPLVRPIDTSTTRLAPRARDPFYDTPKFRTWRRLVLERAGHQCEHVDGYGHRCTRAGPISRMYAHHRIEIRDGGALLDANNGMCLCHQHHEQASAQARSRRMRE
jgi:5-methylcytosine-specific restriction protein A